MFEGDGTGIGAFHEGDGTGIQTLYQGDGTELWSAQSETGSIIDNFEDEPDGPYEDDETIVDYYTITGDSANWERSTDAIQGDYALERTSSEAAAALYSAPDDGLPSYPEVGDTVGLLIRDNDEIPGLVLCADDGIEGYAFYIQPSSSSLDNISIVREGDDSTVLAGTNPEMDVGVWYWGEAFVGSDGTLEWSVYEVDDETLERGSLLGSVTATDDTYLNNDGFGYYVRSASSRTTSWDWVRVIDT